MKYEKKIYRAWRYFRDGFSLYVSKPLSILTFLTTTYYLLINQIAMLSWIFPSFYIYSLIALLTVVPISIWFGYFHMKKSEIYGTEALLATQCNPVSAHVSKLSGEVIIKILETLDIPVPEEYMQLYLFWKELDERLKWKP